MDFSEDMFSRCPVWKWNDSMDGCCPVEDYQPLPEEEATLFLAASFKAPGGERFRGYLVGSESFYAFGIFFGGEEYVFNFRLPGLMMETFQGLQVRLKNEEFELFPLRYETSLRFRGKPRIEGALNPIAGIPHT